MADDPGRPPGLATIGREWGRIGCIGFGGPPTHIKLLRELCVERRQWLDANEFEDALAACNLLPGPASTQLAIFCAWRLRGRAGALLGGAAFIVPGLILILALAALFLSGSPPAWVKGAGAGAGAAVAAVAVRAGSSLVPASWRRARSASQVRWAVYLAAGAAAAATIGPWLVLVLLSCGIAELAAQRTRSSPAQPSHPPPHPDQASPTQPDRTQPDRTQPDLTQPDRTQPAGGQTAGGQNAGGGRPEPDRRPPDSRRPGGRGLGGVAAVPLLAAGAIGGGVTLSLAWVAIKVGALSYGGGFVIIPLMQGDAVGHYHWMTGGQFLNAVALGQITPGPVVQTVAAVGYAAAGLAGGLLAAMVAFAPSFAFILLGARHFGQLRGDWRAAAFLGGAGPAAIGAILGSAIPLTRELSQPWQYAVLGVAAVLLLALRRGVVLTLLVAGAAGVVVALAGGPLPL